jgi:hypothetical protein
MVDEIGTLAGSSLSLKIVETSGETDIAASGATSVSNRRAQLRPGAHLPHQSPKAKGVKRSTSFAVPDGFRLARAETQDEAEALIDAINKADVEARIRAATRRN